jgi:hypothetical protein
MRPCSEGKQNKSQNQNLTQDTFTNLHVTLLWKNRKKDNMKKKKKKKKKKKSIYWTTLRKIKDIGI